MANSVAVAITVDGPRNVVAKVTVIADSSDISATTLLNPATLSATFPPSNLLRVDEIQYSVQDGWSVILYWDATTPKRIVNLTGRGIFPVGPNYGGLQNNAGAGVNGKITLSTSGWSSGSMYATLILHCVKQSGLVSAETGDPILTELGDPLLTESDLELLTE